VHGSQKTIRAQTYKKKHNTSNSSIIFLESAELLGLGAQVVSLLNENGVHLPAGYEINMDHEK
jgi:hypothetical protein